MTRVRITVKNVKDADLAAAARLPGVLKVITSGSEVQVVMGPGKTQRVTHELENMLRGQ